MQAQRCIAPLGMYRFEPHRHKCLKCELVWAHDPAEIDDTESAFDKSHTCPNCGIEALEIYNGPKKPKFVNDGVKCTPLRDCPIEYVSPAEEKRRLKQAWLDELLKGRV